jgi:hypothetical protein
MRKILTTVIISVVILSGLLTIATAQNENNMISTHTIVFSQPKIIEKDNYITISIDETNDYLISSDKPLLPSYKKTFMFPFGTKINDIIIDAVGVYEKELEFLIEPAPKAVIIGSDEYISAEKTMDNIVYNDIQYPTKWAKYKIGTGIKDSNRYVFVNIDVYPVQYYPMQNTIKVAESVDIKIHYEPSEIIISNSFFESNTFIIITPLEFKSALQTLATHKNNNDISTKIVTLEEIYAGTHFPVEGRDEQEQIKYFIKDAIENWDTSFVMLVGGINQLPARKTHVKISSSDQEIFVSDLYYADIYNDTGGFSTWDTNENDVFAEYHWDGNTDQLDLHPDVYIGRLACVDLSEVFIVINKIINYENNEAYTQEWFTNILGIGGDSFTDDHGDDSGVNEGEYVNERVFSVMDGFIPNKLWASNGMLSGSPSGVVNIQNAFEDGAGFVDFSGHGNTNVYATHRNNGSSWLPTPTQGIFNWQIMDFNNNDMLPIVVTGACSVGKYNKDYDCFSWSYLIAPNGGAIASCGASALGYAYIGKYVVQGLVEGMAINMFEAYKDGAITFGEMWGDAINDYIRGNLDAGDHKTIEEWHAFGDPTLAVAKESLKPETPDAPDGPASGSINTEYTYTASTTDPDGDKIYYLFDWGDGEFSGWLGPYNSGQECTGSYTWTSRGDYQIRVKAKDDHGVQSEWSESIPISMPHSKFLLLNGLYDFIESNFPLIFNLMKNLVFPLN